MHVLYISNTGLASPIFQSQGLPHIIAIAKKGVNFSLITFEFSNSDETEEYKNLEKLLEKSKINYYKIDLRFPKFLPYKVKMWYRGITRVFLLFLKNRPSVIHSRSYPPTFIANFFSMLVGVKVIFDMRGTYVDELVESGIKKKGTLAYLFERYLERWYIKHSDKLVSVSNSHFKSINKILSESENLSKNVMIRNSFDNEDSRFISPSKKDYEGLRLIYLGHSTLKYDIEGIFKLYQSIFNLYPASSLDILTYGNATRFLDEKEMLAASAAQKVNISYSSYEDLHLYLSKADVGLILLQPFKSNFVSAPIKFAQYLAFGIPVIISDNIGDTKAIIEKYKVGIILRGNYDSAALEIMELLKDPKISERCRMVVERELNFTKAVSKYFKIYQELDKN